MAYVYSVAPHEQISSYSCFHFTSTDISDFNAQKNVSIKWMIRIHWNAPNRVNILRMYRWKIALFLSFIRRSFISLLLLSTGKTATLTFGIHAHSEKNGGQCEWNDGKNAENSSDGYQSKSKMPKISMKRFRNAIFLVFFFGCAFFLLHISRSWLCCLNDTQTIHICFGDGGDRIMVTFHLGQMASPISAKTLFIPNKSIGVKHTLASK